MELNCDFGEDFGAYSVNASIEILKYVDSINIACGFHAGDPLVMKRTVERAIEHDIFIGAHPGYADLQGFGRRSMELSYDEIYTLVLYQIGALAGFVRAAKGNLHHVKAHGALYNQSAKDPIKAKAIVQAVKDYDSSLILYALSGSIMADIGREAGLTVYEEVFADRRYNEDGTLVDRSFPNALIKDEDEMLRHVASMMKKKEIITISGKTISTNAKTICVHGDGEHALAFVKRIAQMK